VSAESVDCGKKAQEEASRREHRVRREEKPKTQVQKRYLGHPPKFHMPIGRFIPLNPRDGAELAFPTEFRGMAGVWYGF